MRRRKIRDTPELNVPNGYEFEDIYETDDTGFGFEKPILEEEVEIKFGKFDKEQNV